MKRRAMLLLVAAAAVPLTLVPAVGASAALPGPGAPLPGVVVGGLWGDDDTGEGARATRITGTWNPQNDRGSMYTTAKVTDAQDLWMFDDPNHLGWRLTGHGVGVALLDTGISPVEGLNAPGKVVNGPDLSFESQAANTRYLDGYGHGTHMAGIIAGRDAGIPAGQEKDSTRFVGMAPDATLVNVKVAAGDGGADVSQVIAGIDWVVAHRRETNTRVLNLSYGTHSTQDPGVDPLAAAVEHAWQAGIVVVVAAGNDGESGGTRLTDPAIDPYVIAVGSTDHQGSDQPSAWKVGAWTNAGTTSRRPDVVAPGKSIVSLRDPGSLADTEHPEGLVSGETSKRLFRGTGTSQSAAVVSGGVALLLQRNPWLTPDQVKGLLKATATKLPGDSSPTQGAGFLNLRGAVETLQRGAVPAYTQTWARSTGAGSLEAARGGSHATDPDNEAVLSGEQDIFGVAWNGAAWNKASAAGTAWTGGTWRGTAWAGPAWVGSSWPSTAWTRFSWSGVDWSRRSWSTMSFERFSWSGDDWSRRSWSADSWSRRSWSSDDWSRDGGSDGAPVLDEWGLATA
jgi:serine protease AprX